MAFEKTVELVEKYEKLKHSGIDSPTAKVKIGIKESRKAPVAGMGGFSPSENVPTENELVKSD